MMRLDKLLALHGFGTRNHVKKIIKAQRVRVNDDLVVDPAFKLDAELDHVTVDHKTLTHRDKVHYMLNKPQGYICAHTDHRYPSVLELVHEKRSDLIIVGRLDVDTEGLLLISNDGLFSHQVSHGKKAIEKQYHVTLKDPFNRAYIPDFERGIALDDVQLKPAKVTVIDDYTLHLSISEGKKHQVKRMMRYCENEVVFLKRIKIGKLKLDESLSPGAYRLLESHEVDAIFKL